MNQKVRGIVFALSGVLLLLGALLYVIHLSVAPYLFAVGAAGITVCYMSVPVVGLDLRHKRLHRFNIIAGILIGSYGPRFHMLTYTTRSASLMLRGIGLSLYLACLGLDAGAHFFETVMRPEGALWIGIGFIITFVPVVIMALVALRCYHLDFGNTCGMLCGSMANPMALNYANDIIPNDNPAVSYATVYPLGMFTRVIIAQLILMLFL